MRTTTVTLEDDAYELLKRASRPGESFSQTVRRLATRRGSILDFWGMWSELSEREVRNVRAIRSHSRARDLARQSKALE